MKYETVVRLTTVVVMAACALKVCAEEAWTIDTQDAWETRVAASSHLDFKDGMAVPTARTATFRFGLSAGYGFQWEIKITDTTDNASQPILDKMILSFSE